MNISPPSRNYLSGKLEMILYMPIVCLFLILGIGSTKVYAFQTNQSADLVIGQETMESGSVNQGGTVKANTLSRPQQVSVIGTRLYIADEQNRRTLIYDTGTLSTNAVANIVIGQPDMISNGAALTSTGAGSPTGVYAVGSQVFVSDWTYNRMFIFNSIPSSNGAAASLVIGQSNMTSAGAGCSSTMYNGPVNLWSDGTRLFVSDGNHRVLIYSTIPVSNGGAAQVVIGQVDMTQGSANRGGAVAANTLYYPNAICTNGGRLFISDGSNNRVLIFNSIPTANNASANIVIGQADMTHNSVNQGQATPGANTLNDPRGVFFDGQKLFIGDSHNNRILIFNSIPTANNASADIVIGQTSMSAEGSGCTAQQLNTPRELFFTDNKLFVSDYANNRVLIFSDARITSVTPAQGFQNNQVTVALTGDGFTSNMTVKLVNGGTTLSANPITVTDAYSASCVFNLVVPIGTYQVQIDRPGLSTLYKANAFTVLTAPTATPTSTISPTATITPIPMATATPTPPMANTFFKIYSSKINPNRGEKARVCWIQPQTAPVTIIIYNMVGERMFTLVDHQTFNAGKFNNVEWDGRNFNGGIVGSGIYIIHIKTEGYETYSKVSIIK